MDAPVENNKEESTIKPKDKFEGKVLKTSLQGALIDINSPCQRSCTFPRLLTPRTPMLM